MINRYGSVLILFFVWLSPALAAEREVASVPASVSGDTLFVLFPFASFLTSDDSASIVDGEPVSVICRLELWQKRRLWFDRMRTELIAYAVISYDRWSEKFVADALTSADTDSSFDSAYLDSLAGTLQYFLTFPFRLQPGDYAKESYMAYSLELQYVTPDKVGELKDWLFGGKHKKSPSIQPRGQSLPGKLFNIVLNSTGFRNRSYVRSSLPFFPGQITGSISFPAALN